MLISFFFRRHCLKMVGFLFSIGQSLVIHQFQDGFTSSCKHSFVYLLFENSSYTEQECQRKYDLKSNKDWFAKGHRHVHEEIKIFFCCSNKNLRSVLFHHLISGSVFFFSLKRVPLLVQNGSIIIPLSLYRIVF